MSRITDRNLRTPLRQGDWTDSMSSCTKKLKSLNYNVGKIETEEPCTIKEENPVVIEDRPKKKSRRHESSDIELLKDDLRVVVFHPDQQQLISR